MKAMELEIDSNINSTHSSSSIVDIVPNSKQVPIKKSLNLDSIIKALLEKYSLNVGLSGLTPKLYLNHHVPDGNPISTAKDDNLIKSVVLLKSLIVSVY